jgi:FkbM family methyltransferase
MPQSLKNFIKLILHFLHLDLTKNLEYDRLTSKILKTSLKTNSNCIDIGCHKGEILEIMLKHASSGKHFAFEPLPILNKNLMEKYSDKVEVFPYALSDQNGTSTFQYVKNAPAYSGLKRRKYDIQHPDIEEIQVEVKRLDEIIPSNSKIHLIKIDVEGGELGVIKGGLQLLKNNKPLIIFECGKGASDYYNTTPEEMYQFITSQIGLHISTLKAFQLKKNNLTEAEFCHLYNTNKEYYFIAHP